MASINISSLNTTLGAYARENKVEAFRKVLKESTKDLFTLYGGSIDQLPLTRMRTASILKPYAAGGGFTATDDALSLSARILNVRRCSFDVEIVPLDLYNSWLGMIEGAPNGSPFDIPLEQFMMDSIMAQVVDDLETAVWTGTYNASGSTPAATMSGILTLVTAAITALEIPAGNVTAGAALTSSNAFDEFKLVRDKIAPEYRNKEMLCLCSVAAKDKYLTDYQATLGATPYNSNYDQIYLEGTRAKIVAVPGLGTSSRVLVTPKENLVYGFDVDGPQSNIQTQEFNRTIKVMGDFRAGVEFRDGQVIWCNNQA
jgi:hypothetical protein